MSNSSYTIYTKSNSTINVDYITTGPTEITRGNKVQFNFEADNLSLLQDYIEYAGSYSTLEDLDGVINYSENLPTNADVDSLVLGIEPNTELQGKDVFGIWGIVDSATDNRPKALTTNQLGINLLVLAKYSDYADHTAIESGLKMDV